MMKFAKGMAPLAWGLLSIWTTSPALAEDAVQQSRDDAWWTGPILAVSANGPGQGHVLAESYLYDQAEDHSQSYRSFNYLLYGLSDHFTLGVIPVFGINKAEGAHAQFGMSDLTFQAQYTLTDFDPKTPMPAIAVALRQSIATGKYDRLNQVTEAFGAGSGATSLGLFTQDYFWLPNGRILRVRADALASVFATAHVEDASVFGTPSGFSGHARPGDAVSLDVSFEYSLTRGWVLATELLYDHGDADHVEGADAGRQLRFDLGSSDGFGFAPAVEYSWLPNWGVLLGARILPSGRNRPFSVTPAIALNVVT
jgi:Putative MetA-pathway of phenol degradation